MEVADSLLLSQLRGLVATKLALHDKHYLNQLLAHMLHASTSIQDAHDICDVLESLMTLKSMIDEEEPVFAAGDVEKNITATVTDESSPEQTEEKCEGKSTETAIIYKPLLTAVALAAIDVLPKFTAEGMLRIVTVLCNAPFQCDDLVAAIEGEIDQREKNLAERTDLETAIQTALSSVLSIKSAILAEGGEDSKSPLSAVQNGLRSIFRHTTKDSDDEIPDKPESAQTPDHLVDIKEVEEFLVAATSALNLLQASFEADTKLPVNGVDQEFALSRCRVAIDQYRRIDFRQGSQETRFDQQRRRDISKKLLSRLLP